MIKRPIILSSISIEILRTVKKQIILTELLLFILFVSILAVMMKKYLKKNNQYRYYNLWV